MTVLPELTPASLDRGPALRRVIVLATLTALVMFLPFILSDGGRFTLIADFNQQQIPFNQHSAWTLRNGSWGWDWYTDLGVNFIGAFSFYTLGSPFFWIASLFGPQAFPDLIGWLYIAKYVTAAVLSFLWLRDHVEDPDFAVIGGLLYAFSGFSQINLMYYHFHEVIAFFPLLLLSLDHFLQKGRRGWFALAVAINALINYFFFFAQVLFLLLYFFVFYHFPNRKERTRQFLRVLGEGILGVVAAGILILPSALFILSSPKTGQLLYWKDFFLYGVQRYLAIIKAMIFPAEAMIIQSSVLPFDFSSASLYLPLIGFSMVLTAAMTHRRNRHFLLVFLIILFLPGLNAIFTLLNSTYYARWFYMPLLVLTAFSIQSLESAPRETRLRGVNLALILTGAFLLINGLVSQSQAKWIQRPDLFFGSGLIALIGLGLTRWVFRRRDQYRQELMTRLVILAAIITGIYSLTIIRSFHPAETQQFAQGYFDELARLDLTPAEGENQQDYRFYTYNAGWNLSMVNHIPSVNSFITTNSASVHEFFRAVGIDHIAASRFPADSADILTFLSVRYRIDERAPEYYRPVSEARIGDLDLVISENPDFLPLGFPLDQWISKADLELLPKAQRARVLLQALVIPEGSEPPAHLTKYLDQGLTTGQIAGNLKSRTVREFQRDHRGFSAALNTPNTQTILFTVPWDRGWSATLNGSPAPIRSDLGFMAIDVPPGETAIEFTYRIPGLQAGLILSLLGSIAILALILRQRQNELSGTHLQEPVRK